MRVYVFASLSLSVHHYLLEIFSVVALSLSSHTLNVSLAFRVFVLPTPSLPPSPLQSKSEAGSLPTHPLSVNG